MNLETTPGSRWRAALALAGLAAFAASLAAQTTVVVPCDRDNTLYESATGSLSNGRGQGLFVGYTGQPARRRALLHFDVAAFVPAGARIVSAVLRVNVSRSAVGSNFDATAHRVLRNWGEGTSNASGQEGSGAAATTNDATWLHTFFPSTFWSSPGGDFAAAASCTISLPPLGPTASPATAGMNADVQDWLDDPTHNFGWLLKRDELVSNIAFRLDSRDAPAGSIKPSLTVSYLLPGQVASWGQGCQGSGAPFAYALAGTPTGGTTVALVQSHGPSGSLAANLLSLAFDPAGSPLLPQCALYLPLAATVTQGLVLLDGSGNGSTPFPIPPGYPGVLLAGQSAALDNSPQGYVLSNTWLAVVN